MSPESCSADGSVLGIGPSVRRDASRRTLTGGRGARQGLWDFLGPSLQAIAIRRRNDIHAAIVSFR